MPDLRKYLLLEDARPAERVDRCNEALERQVISSDLGKS
jgi:hypothetical protein